MSPHTGGPPYTCFPVIETAAGLRSKGSRVTVNERKKNTGKQSEESQFPRHFNNE